MVDGDPIMECFFLVAKWVKD